MGAVLIWEDRMRREEGRGKVDQILFFKKKKRREKENNFFIKKTKKTLKTSTNSS